MTTSPLKLGGLVRVVGRGVARRDRGFLEAVGVLGARVGQAGEREQGARELRGALNGKSHAATAEGVAAILAHATPPGYLSRYCTTRWRNSASVSASSGPIVSTTSGSLSVPPIRTS